MSVFNNLGPFLFSFGSTRTQMALQVTPPTHICGGGGLEDLVGETLPNDALGRRFGFREGGGS